MPTITNPLREARQGGRRLEGTRLSRTLARWLAAAWGAAGAAREALERRSVGLATFSAATLLALLSVLDLLGKGWIDIDFRSYYFAWQAAARGADVYDVAQINRIAASELHAAGHVWPYIYPPFLAYALSPMASLPFAKAAVVWALGSVVAFGVAVTAIAGSIAAASDDGAGPRAERGSRLSRAVSMAALLVGLLPLRSNIEHGQVNLFVVALLALAMRAFLRGRDVSAGALLAPAILVKLTPGVFVLFFLARRRPRAALACGAAVLVLAAATVVAGALPAWRTYVEILPRISHGAFIRGLFDPALVWNFSPAGMYSRMFHGHEDLVRVLGAATAAVLLGAAAVVTLRGARRVDGAIAMAPYFLLVLLVSPLVYAHHVIFLAPAAAVWIDRAWREHRPWLLIAVVALLLVASADLPPLYWNLGLRDGLPVRLLTSMSLWALLALFAIGLHLQREPSRSA